MFENFTKELDEACLASFPEMLQEHSRAELLEASETGRYIFFEDYFNAFIQKHKTNETILKRVAPFIENLAQSEHDEIRNLVEIGILSGLVSRDVTTIAKYLGPRSKHLLGKASSHTNIDRDAWRLKRDK